MAAPLGNRNAAKDESEQLLAVVNMRAHPREKAAWRRAAAAAGSDCLTDWIRARLNAAAGFDAARVLGRAPKGGARR